MFTSFWKLRPEESDQLRRYMCSALYRSYTDGQYAASDFWADLSRRTFTAINGDMVMLHSGHRFIEETKLSNSSFADRVRNSIIGILSMSGWVLQWLTIVHSYVGSSLKAAEEVRLKRICRKSLARAGRAEKLERGGVAIPEILSGAAKYNESKVYDSIENMFYIESILEHSTYAPLFLEIGAGAGLTSLLLLDRVPNSKVVICDLPVSICVGYTLTCFFGQSTQFKALLPHQISAEALKMGLFDIAFITPDQLALLEPGSVDGIVNVHSMQEMTIATIRSYFEAIRHVARKGAFFYCKNLEISKQYVDTRFEDYPWDLLGQTILDGVAEYATSVYTEGSERIRVRLVRVEGSGEGDAEGAVRDTR